MKQIDFDRAFPQTPDCISAAIELGIREGKRKIKFRNKLIAAGSIAAAFAILLTAALTVGLKRPDQPDVLTAPPLTLPAQPVPMVYSTEGADYYHMEADCSGMENAAEMTESEAVQMGKKPCPVCISISCDGHEGEEIEYVYYSQGGLYFHKQEECSSGKMPLKGEYFAVIGAFPGKEPCKECFPEGIEICLHGRAFVAEPAPTPTPEPAETGKSEKTESESLDAKKSTGGQAENKADSSIVYTAYGKSHSRYHIIKNCNGGDYRRELTQAQAIHENLDACDACYFGFVCYTEQGIYYHSDAECSGMMNANLHTRRDARRDGKIPCPVCLMVYANEGGLYFHLLDDCMGMMFSDLHTQEEVYAMGNLRCPLCLSPATVYATKLGRYFHAREDCSGMEGASATTPETEWNNGKTPCPLCITGDSTRTLKVVYENSTLGERAGQGGETSVRLPEHHELFTKAFGKGINELIPGYHFDHEAVHQDPELGNGRVWKLKNGTDPDEETIPGCWLFEKDGMYDAYCLMVNLSTSTDGYSRNNLDTFMDGAVCTLYGNSFALSRLYEAFDIHSYVAKQTGTKDIDGELQPVLMMVQFGIDDEVSGYDILWVNGKGAYTVRIGLAAEGGLHAEAFETWK